MKRRILICLLALCMLLAMVPVMGITVAAKDDAKNVVATVKKDDKVIFEATKLTDAVSRALKNEGSTLVLEADIEITAGYDLRGNYTFDLNGHTVKAHTPFIITALEEEVIKVTFVDSSEAKTGNITGIDCPALELQGGNAILKSGTFTSTNGKYAVAVLGTGVLYLADAPVISKPVYMKNADTVVGNDGAESSPAPYTGGVVSIYFGQETITEGMSILKNANENFEIIARGEFVAKKDGDGLIMAKSNAKLFMLIGAIAGGVVLLAVIAIVLIIVLKKVKKAKANKKSPEDKDDVVAESDTPEEENATEAEDATEIEEAEAENEEKDN